MREADLRLPSGMRQEAGGEHRGGRPQRGAPGRPAVPSRVARAPACLAAPWGADRARGWWCACRSAALPGENVGLLGNQVGLLYHLYQEGGAIHAALGAFKQLVGAPQVGVELAERDLHRADAVE